MSRLPLEPDDFSWLGKEPKHQCGPRCTHKAGIETERPPVATPSPEKPGEGVREQVPAGGAPTPSPEDPCEDCACLLKDHMGSKGNCVYCACKAFVPIGPKN